MAEKKSKLSPVGGATEAETGAGDGVGAGAGEGSGFGEAAGADVVDAGTLGVVVDEELMGFLF